MSRCFLFIFILLITPMMALAAEPTAEQLREDFDFFWNSYKEAYVFWQLKAEDFGVDWDLMRQEYEATLAQVKTKRELLRLITEMQTKLKDGHCGNEGMTACGPIALIRGIAFTPTAGNKIHVSAVAPGTLISDTGVETGDELLTWKGKPVATLARQARTLVGASSEGQFWSIFAQLLHVHHPYLGEPDEKCVCSFKKPNGTVIDAELPWEYINPAGGKAGPSLAQVIAIDSEGPLPMKAMIFEDLNIGYISVKSFMKPEFPKGQLDKVFGAVKDTDALILDLRGNGGGVGPWGVLLANYMVSEGPDGAYMERKYSRTFFRAILAQMPPEQLEAMLGNPQYLKMILDKLGIQMTQQEVQDLFVDGEYKPFYHTSLLKDMVPQDLSPGVEPYLKPVYALTDGGCYSTTDICLKLMKEFDRVTIVGTPNGAGSGSPIPITLPNCKVKVMVPHARAYPPSGEMIEGRPLTPDHIVEVTQEDLVKGVDRHIVTALALAGREMGILGGPSKFAPAAVEINHNDLATKTVVDTTGQSKIPEELRALIPVSVQEAYINKLPTIDVEK